MKKQQTLKDDWVYNLYISKKTYYTIIVSKKLKTDNYIHFDNKIEINVIKIKSVIYCFNLHILINFLL